MSTGWNESANLRRLDDKHHYTIVCHDFAQLSQFVFVSNKVFRLIKAHTRAATFILPSHREVPRRFMNPKKRTVGVRIPLTGGANVGHHPRGAVVVQHAVDARRP